MTGHFFKSKSERLSPALRAALDRYRDRLRHTLRIQRTHALRKHRKWTQACQANLTKLRYRHANQYAQQTPDPWTNLISAQIEKFANQIDLVNAWHRREFSILEKMNSGAFRQDLVSTYGSVWSYVADIQVIKATRFAKCSRRVLAIRKYWSQTLLAGFGRFRHGATSRPDPWISAILNKASKVQKRTDWQATTWNAFRRTFGS